MTPLATGRRGSGPRRLDEQRRGRPNLPPSVALAPPTATRHEAFGGGVADIQRVRMIAATAEITRERGLGEVTVSRIVARSGVSRRTFYQLFDDREDCFRGALDFAVQCAARRVLPAYHAPDSWREQMRAGLAALLEFLDDEPDLGALCVVDALGAGRGVREDRARIVTVLVDAVDAGRPLAKGSMRPTRLTAEGVVGAVLAVLHARLPYVGSGPKCEIAEDGSPSANASMTGLLAPLMGLITLPYCGSAVAAREMARTTPPRRRPTRPGGDPLRDLDMRLTYRTVRVLLAIAASPGASNRGVADLAEVTDQGQISKLLRRLEHLELIDNACPRPARGGPNAWRLTAHGERIAQSIGGQTAA